MAARTTAITRLSGLRTHSKLTHGVDGRPSSSLLSSRDLRSSPHGLSIRVWMSFQYGTGLPPEPLILERERKPKMEAIVLYNFILKMT
jgi:hypothetical protein